MTNIAKAIILALMIVGGMLAGMAASGDQRSRQAAAQRLADQQLARITELQGQVADADARTHTLVSAAKADTNSEIETLRADLAAAQQQAGICARRLATIRACSPAKK